jgi:poly(A) polymerase
LYDVHTAEILDWVGGLADIEKKTIRSIGAPERRLSEDPVRIVRAMKFSAKLQLEIESDLRDQKRVCAPLLADCSKARLIEETFKILRSGYAETCVSGLQAVDALRYTLSLTSYQMT